MQYLFIDHSFNFKEKIREEMKKEEKDLWFLIR